MALWKKCLSMQNHKNPHLPQLFQTLTRFFFAWFLIELSCKPITFLASHFSGLNPTWIVSQIAKVMGIILFSGLEHSFSYYLGVVVVENLSRILSNHNSKSEQRPVSNKRIYALMSTLWQFVLKILNIFQGTHGFCISWFTVGLLGAKVPRVQTWPAQKRFSRGGGSTIIIINFRFKYNCNLSKWCHELEQNQSQPQWFEWKW